MQHEPHYTSHGPSASVKYNFLGPTSNPQNQNLQGEDQESVFLTNTMSNSDAASGSDQLTSIWGPLVLQSVFQII